MRKHMRRVFTLLLALVLLLNCGPVLSGAASAVSARSPQPGPALGWVNPFSDVPEGKYYYEPVMWAYYHTPQIASGTGGGKFSPGKPCTREQIMTFLWKAKGAPEPKGASCPFSDVKKGKYYYKPVLWAVENGITGGVGGGKFGVGKPCTRAQSMTFLWKALGSPDPASDSNPFPDVNPNKYYYKAVLWAYYHKPQVANGLTSGDFGVGKTCTRGQIVTFLYKAMYEPDQPLTITKQPVGGYFASSVFPYRLSIEVSGGISPYSFEWQYWDIYSETWENYGNGQSVEVSAKNCDKYRCVVTDKAGKERISDTAIVDVVMRYTGGSAKIESGYGTSQLMGTVIFHFSGGVARYEVKIIRYANGISSTVTPEILSIGLNTISQDYVSMWVPLKAQVSGKWVTYGYRCIVTDRLGQSCESEILYPE